MNEGLLSNSPCLRTCFVSPHLSDSTFTQHSLNILPLPIHKTPMRRKMAALILNIFKIFKIFS